MFIQILSKLYNSKYHLAAICYFIVSNLERKIWNLIFEKSIINYTK